MNRPAKPSKTQLKQQAKLLEHSLFKPSKPINIKQFIQQLQQQQEKTNNNNNNPNNSNPHLERACTLNDLITPLEPIYKDSNLLLELKDHQHELATPHGSLHALHLAESPQEMHHVPPPTKKQRQTDIPVESHPPERRIPDYLDPSLFDSSSSTKGQQQSTYDPSHQRPPPRRVRKKAAGPPQPIIHKPKPIQDLINRLAATGLKSLQPDFDGMWYVRSVGRSDWNTSTQPMHSNLPHPAPMPMNAQPPTTVMLTITFHPFSKTTSGGTQETSGEAKSIAPRKQTIHILSSQTLADLRDVVVCSANQIPVCSSASLPHASWLDRRWISGSAFIIQNVLFSDSSNPPSQPPLASQKLDYATLLQELLPDLIEKEKVEDLVSIEEEEIEGDEPPTSGEKKKKKKIQMSTLSMEHVRFEQLTLRINEPYWMLHQGNCEHIFTIDEIRAMHATDPAPYLGSATTTTGGSSSSTGEGGSGGSMVVGEGRRTGYPMTSFLSRMSSPKCRVCDRDPARVVAIGDALCAESPCFVCRTCFRLLHAHDPSVLSLPPNPDPSDDSLNIRWGIVPDRDWWVVPLRGSS